MTYSHSEELIMPRRLRVFLTNTQHNPTRAEISSIDRSVGERFFHDIQLEWAGWAVLDDEFKLSAQWLTEESQLTELTYRVEHNELQGYRIRIYFVDDEEAEETQIF